MKCGYYVFIARSAAAEADFHRIDKSVDNLLTRHHLCKAACIGPSRRHDLSFIMAKRAILFLIRVYRRYISPCSRRAAGFIPTCSTYAMQAVEKYGALKGGWLAVKRILRCNPFNDGGYDPVP